jgi:hypothetical protein
MERLIDDRRSLAGSVSLLYGAVYLHAEASDA